MSILFNNRPNKIAAVQGVEAATLKIYHRDRECGLASPPVLKPIVYRSLIILKKTYYFLLLLKLGRMLLSK